jgi:hypothetical protein
MRVQTVLAAADDGRPCLLDWRSGDVSSDEMSRQRERSSTARRGRLARTSYGRAEDRLGAADVARSQGNGVTRTAVDDLRACFYDFVGGCCPTDICRSVTTRHDTRRVVTRVAADSALPDPRDG